MEFVFETIYKKTISTMVKTLIKGVNFTWNI